MSYHVPKNSDQLKAGSFFVFSITLVNRLVVRVFSGRVTGWRVTGWRATGWRVTGGRVTGGRVTGGRLNGRRVIRTLY